MNIQDNPTKPGHFDIATVAASFPPTATTLLLDQYLVDREVASVRVFRVYQTTPPHFHVKCDEYLYVFSGRGTFWMGDESRKTNFGPGQLLFFERGTLHALPEILEEPVVFLSIDTPRREPDDVHFVNPADGTAASFIQPNKR
jgi:mannose-6-phosphate isomerase-like protein (cupin superfamily)